MTHVLSYDGQPATCYGCGETDHIFQICPKRQKRTHDIIHATRVYMATAAHTDSSCEHPMTNEEQDDRLIAGDDNTVLMTLPLTPTVT
jgi:hypothetical protein